MRRAGAALPLIALLAVAMVVEAPSAAAAGGTNTGGAGVCSPGPSRIIIDYATPKPVDANVTGGGSLNCPAPQANPGGAFGTRTTRQESAQPGALCRYVYAFPVQFRMAGGAYQVQVPTQPVGLPPNNVTLQPPGWSDLATFLKGFGWTGPVMPQDTDAAASMY